jgi:sugar fermentation stimulation protein A
MKISSKLAAGLELEEVRFLKRYKRFLVVVERSDGSILTVHNPNTGSMKSCLKQGCRAIISLKPADIVTSGKAKLPGTLELLHSGRGWIGVNTMRTNGIIAAALDRGAIRLPVAKKDAAALLSGSALKRATRLGLSLPGEQVLESGRSGQADSVVLMEPTLKDYSFRPDLYFRGWLVEVKNVTQIDGQWIQFPDAVSERGSKHMRELAGLAQDGYRCAVVFALSRPEGKAFRPATSIDPEFADSLKWARSRGLKILAHRFRYGVGGVHHMGPVPVRL